MVHNLPVDNNGSQVKFSEFCLYHWKSNTYIYTNHVLNVSYFPFLNIQTDWAWVTQCWMHLSYQKLGFVHLHPPQIPTHWEFSMTELTPLQDRAPHKTKLSKPRPVHTTENLFFQYPWSSYSASTSLNLWSYSVQKIGNWAWRKKPNVCTKHTHTGFPQTTGKSQKMNAQGCIPGNVLT